MFKNASIYKIKLPQPLLLAALNELAAAYEFVPCGASQDRSIGWVPPRGQEHGAMVEQIGGHLILRLMIETKAVPSQALKEKVDEQVKHIEATTGRKPGKKEKRELTDDARLAMLPMAFAQRAAVWVWIDPAKGMLVIDSASQARLDVVTQYLVMLVDGTKIQHLNTQASPQACMALWLTDVDAPRGMFDIGRECLLKACDESKAVVRYAKHSLDIDEVRQHIRHGKVPVKLALSYDDRVSFVLTSSMQITGLKFLEPVFEERAGDTNADAFDADVAILTGELSKLIPDLVVALGGEVVEEGGGE